MSEYTGIQFILDSGSGGPGGTFGITNHTDSATLAASDAGNIHTMTNVAAKSLTLPAIADCNLGDQFIFRKLGTGGLTIPANAADNIEGNSNVINSTTEVGVYFRCVAEEANKWGVYDMMGTWEVS